MKNEDVHSRFSHLTFGPEIPAFTECIRGAWSTQREVAVSKLDSILNTTLIFLVPVLCRLELITHFFSACAWKQYGGKIT